jgi:hypothetical protein
MQAGGWGYRVVLALSGITLILVLVYLSISQQNRSIQAEVDRRQQFISQSIEFGRVDEALIRIIASVAVNDRDDKLRGLLAQNGIAINPKTGGPAAAPASGSHPAPAGKGQ